MADRIHGFVVALVLLVAFVACKKSAKTEQASLDPAAPVAPATASGSAVTATPPDPAATETTEDSPFAKPTLSEDKIQRYIKSLAEQSPFDDRPKSFEASTALEPKLEAFAKKHGFASAAEYGDTMQRIMAGGLQGGITDTVVSMRANLVETIANYEKQIADPAMAESKATLTEMLASVKQQLVEHDAAAKEGTGANVISMNAPDLALIKKFESEITAAEKAKQAKQQK